MATYVRRSSRYLSVDGMVRTGPSVVPTITLVEQVVVEPAGVTASIAIAPGVGAQQVRQGMEFVAVPRARHLAAATPPGYPTKPHTSVVPPTPTAKPPADRPEAPAHVAQAEVARATIWQRLSKRKQVTALYAMALVVFAVGIAVSLNGLFANKKVASQVKQAQKQTEQTVADNPVPTADKPSATVVRNYAVAPNLPRYLDIPKLGVHTRTFSEGVNKSGEMQVPWNIYDAGWYNASAQPGQQGAMLVAAHSGVGKIHGVFHDLAKLAKGDPLVITRGDGQTFTYLVQDVQTVNVSDVDMGSMLVSLDTAKPGLNLITCAGDIIPGTERLNQRILVRAVLQ